MDILILHGWEPSAESAQESYKSFIALLKNKKHRVFAPDMPGFGTAKVPNHPFTVSDYAEWVTRYIRENDIEKPLVIGHSFGGRVAIKLAAKYPLLIHKLVLTGAPGFPPVSKQKISILKLIAKTGGFICSLPLVSLFKPLVRKLFYKSIGAWDYYHAQGVLRETFKNIISEDLGEPMTKIKTETLLVWGAYDLLVPLWIARKMERTIKGSRLHIILGGGHCVIYEDPDKFLESVDTILRQ